MWNVCGMKTILDCFSDLYFSVSLDNVVSPVCCIISGFMQQKLGPRIVLIWTCLPYILGWISAIMTQHFHSVFIKVIEKDHQIFQWFNIIHVCLIGAGNGFLTTPVYSAEVTKKELRGSFSVLEAVSRNVGMIIIFGIGAFLDWTITEVWLEGNI